MRDESLRLPPPEPTSGPGDEILATKQVILALTRAAVGLGDCRENGTCAGKRREGAAPPRAGPSAAGPPHAMPRALGHAAGTPDAPQCGFSRKVASALRAEAVPFGSFDILSDQAVRQGLKVRAARCSAARVPASRDFREAHACRGVVP